MIIRSSIKHSQIVSQNEFSSFEYQEVNISLESSTLNLIILYRPPPNSRNKITVQQFYNEFTSLLEAKTAMSCKLLIVGDFNFHFEDLDNSYANRFKEVLATFDLTQHVVGATHSKGHTLDLIITRSDDDLIVDTLVRDTGVSDHFWIESTLQGPKPKTFRKVITYRKTKAIDVDSFRGDLHNSGLLKLDSMMKVQDCVTMYNQVLSELLDKHAPAITKTITVHPDTPWYSEEIDVAKKERRLAEKIWRKSKLTVHREIYMDRRETVNKLLRSAKQNHYNKLITETNDQKRLLLCQLCFQAQCTVLLLIESLFQKRLMQTVRIHLLMDLNLIRAVQSYIPVVSVYQKRPQSGP